MDHSKQHTQLLICCFVYSFINFIHNIPFTSTNTNDKDTFYLSFINILVDKPASTSWTQRHNISIVTVSTYAF